MSDFRFDSTRSFDENCEAFLAALDAVDAEMAAILRANEDALGAIVREGERDPKARAEFNDAVMAALDALNAPDSQQDGQ